ncbi:MAG TPA: carotenoid biosynthesis protein [Candidatus Dormibacteraeota bacterium]|nr:carotenoid biosynthesis protein [Candidatus Dormibacteraeota bacterium]
MNPAFLGLELAATAFFVGAALAAARRGRLPFLELVSAAIFGILLEEGDQLIYGTYHYADDWVLVIDRAPVVIGLTWALIIAGAMRITDALGVRRRYAPFVDALLAISLDLAFDAIAIRMGLWTWVGVDATQGWFGVPWGNFYAWLFVTLGFSLLTRWLRDAAARHRAWEWLQLAVPIPAFAILTAAIVPFALLKPAIDQEPGGGGPLFMLALAAFVVAAAWGVFGPDRVAPNGQRRAILDLRLAFLTRAAIHGFFLTALLVMGLAFALPVLLVVAVGFLAAELPLVALVRSRLTDARAATAAREPESGPAAALPYR